MKNAGMRAATSNPHALPSKAAWAVAYGDPRMSDRTKRRNWAASRLLLLLLAPATLVAALAVPPAVRAGPCDQVGGVITGDWTVSTAQVCTGILYTVDGSVTVNAGGSLTLVDGGLKFAKDASHTTYALTVNAGGELVLDHSTVTVETDSIAPYLKLAFTVSGANSRLTMKNGASLKFPGTFSASGATLDITDSTVTGFTSTELLGLGLYSDDNDDGPVIDWASTTAALYRSTIERVYENTSAASDPNATGVIEADITLRTGTTLYAYDSHLGVDFSNVRGLHNELLVDATSSAYLYAVTVDRVQDPVVQTDWRPPFVPAAGGNVYLLRWLRLTATDSTGFPVSGASVASTLSPSASPAQFPDNGFAAVPSARTLAYLGRTLSGPAAWDVTDTSGVANIPLWTDQVTSASLPNAESFGNYRETITFQSSTVTMGVNFAAYPATSPTDNTVAAAVPLPVTVRTGPDLALNSADYAGTMTVSQGQTFTVYVIVYNQGQTDASGVAVAAYVGGNEVTRATGLSVPYGASVNQSLIIPGVGVLGTVSLLLRVDPNNTVVEGGVAQESNNFANVTLNVLPPPSGFVAILSPDRGQVIEPGSSLSVSGYVRDDNATGLVGVPLTIELRSGTALVASTTTTSQALGFFLTTIDVPSNTADGPYTVTVAASPPITGETRPIEIKTAVPFLSTPLLGLPVWLWMIIVVGAAAAIGGGTAYVKFVGLGKLVECGECGSYIRGDSAKCPKCGVEFEKGMAKCSNCQTWIPQSVKQCPECGVEFATGEVEMADYEAQMKVQYEEVKRRFRVEASRELGHALSDREFADWWRTQPTFVTFEDWLREEEDMRRMGSRPCPVCNTLNSVTAKVCHKCGSLMREESRRGGRPPRGGGGPWQSHSVSEEAAEAPLEPVPPKVVKKEVVSGPVVQKKVVTSPPPPEDPEAGSATGA